MTNGMDRLQTMFTDAQEALAQKALTVDAEVSHWRWVRDNNRGCRHVLLNGATNTVFGYVDVVMNDFIMRVVTGVRRDA